MDHEVWAYLVHLAVSIGLTVWVATTLSRNGLVFLPNVFAERLHRAAPSRAAQRPRRRGPEAHA